MYVTACVALPNRPASSSCCTLTLHARIRTQTNSHTHKTLHVHTGDHHLPHQGPLRQRGAIPSAAGRRHNRHGQCLHVLVCARQPHPARSATTTCSRLSMLCVCVCAIWIIHFTEQRNVVVICCTTCKYPMIKQQELRFASPENQINTVSRGKRSRTAACNTAPDNASPIVSELRVQRCRCFSCLCFTPQPLSFNEVNCWVALLPGVTNGPARNSGCAHQKAVLCKQ